MPRQFEEKRTQGALVSFVDLLFLLVAFMVMLLYFVQGSKTALEGELEATQEVLTSTDQQLAEIQSTVEEWAPLLEQFLINERQAAEQRRELAAREYRRRQRNTLLLSYEITSNGWILYEQRPYPPDAFLAEVVAPLRAENWVAFRAQAQPQTPFGVVVQTRKILLENRGEFDTYWDNLSEQTSRP